MPSHGYIQIAAHRYLTPSFSPNNLNKSYSLWGRIAPWLLTYVWKPVTHRLSTLSPPRPAGLTGSSVVTDDTAGTKIAPGMSLDGIVQSRVFEEMGLDCACLMCAEKPRRVILREFMTWLDSLRIRKNIFVEEDERIERPHRTLLNCWFVAAFYCVQSSQWDLFFAKSCCKCSEKASSVLKRSPPLKMKLARHFYFHQGRLSTAQKHFSCSFPSL